MVRSSPNGTRLCEPTDEGRANSIRSDVESNLDAMGDRLHNLSFEDLKRLDAMVKGLLVEYPERAVIELPVGEGDQLIALPATQGAARLDASEAIDRAVGLYFRWHERAGRTAVQPSRVTCELIDSTIYIRSGDRDLARYRVSGDGKMRRIWPKAAT